MEWRTYGADVSGGNGPDEFNPVLEEVLLTHLFELDHLGAVTAWL